MIFHLHISRVQTVALFLSLPLARKFAFIHKKEGEQACGRRKSVGKASNDERGKRKTIKRQAATRRRRRQTRQPGVLSENRGCGKARRCGRKILWEWGGKAEGGSQVFWSFAIFALIVVASLTFRFIYINTHRIRINECVLGWEIFVSVCVLFLFIFFLPNAPENKTRSEQKKMNAAYLLLFTTNTNEGTKEIFKQQNRKKEQNFEHCGKTVICTERNCISKR